MMLERNRSIACAADQVDKIRSGATMHFTTVCARD